MQHGQKICYTTHVVWVGKSSYNPCGMDGQSVVQQLLFPCSMGDCHITFPMWHGERVTEWALILGLINIPYTRGWSQPCALLPCMLPLDPVSSVRQEPDLSIPLASSVLILLATRIVFLSECLVCFGSNPLHTPVPYLRWRLLPY